MPVATMISKGRITIPVAVRRALGLQTGAEISFVRIDGGYKIVPLHANRVALKGRFAGRVAKPVTLAQIDAAVAEAAEQRIDRSGD